MVDRARLDEAQRLVGAPSASATIDLALDALIRQRRLLRDIAVYAQSPPSDDEIALAALPPVVASDLADDTDWAALYADEPAA